jgi:hypothetical protein
MDISKYNERDKYYEEILKIIRSEGWLPRHLTNPVARILSDYQLWFPATSTNQGFFTEYGLVYKPLAYYSNDRRFSWVKVEKKIFNSLDKYKVWSKSIQEKINSLNKEAIELLTKIQNLKMEKIHKAHKISELENKLKNIEEEKRIEWAKKPTYVLSSDHVYYLCYEVDTEDVIGSSNNPELLDTIIFNMELFNNAR